MTTNRWGGVWETAIWGVGFVAITLLLYTTFGAWYGVAFVFFVGVCFGFWAANENDGLITPLLGVGVTVAVLSVTDVASEIPIQSQMHRFGVFEVSGFLGFYIGLSVTSWRRREPPPMRWNCSNAAFGGECTSGLRVDDPFDLCDECKRKEEVRTPPEPRWAHLLDRDDVLVLDTQTTGLDADAEVTDVAVIDTRGRVLLHDLRRGGETSYRDIHRRLMRVIERASIICVYNSGYELQMIKQSATRHGLDATIGADVVCIMEEYAEHYTNDGRWPTLAKAAAAEGVSVGGARHHPLTDVRLTLGLVRAVVDRERAQAKREQVEAERDVLLTEDDIPF